MQKELFERLVVNERDRGFCAATAVPLGEKTLVFVSGEVGRDGSGALIDGDFEAEARQAFANIGRALQAAGASFADVVRVTAYIKHLSDYATYAQVRGEMFGEHRPASATVGVADLLLGARLEIDAIAVVRTAP